MIDDRENGPAEPAFEPTITRDRPVTDEPEATIGLEDESTRTVTEMFCPSCGGRFPGGTSNCTEDGTVLLPVGFGNDMAGTVLNDKYVLVQLIGSGGFGHVYRATHKLAKAEIAIKVIRDEIRDNAKARRQFLKEARALMRIQSRHAVVVHDVDEDSSGRIFIVMEFLRGQDLEDHIKIVSPTTRRLPWKEAARIVIEVCDALEDAHDQGIVHRDLKPGNVMMVRGRGGKPTAKVVDFGIASLAQAGDMDLTTMDAVPRVIGTPSFMSPEQAKGQQVDHRSDLYSLGAMMYRLVCGCRPFDAKTDQGMLIAHVTEDPASIMVKCPEADVPPEFDALIMQLLKKNPAERPADAAEVATRLKDMLPPESKESAAAAAGKDGGKSGGVSRIVIALIVVAVLAAAAAGAYFVLGSGPATATNPAPDAGAVPAGAVQPGSGSTPTPGAVQQAGTAGTVQPGAAQQAGTLQQAGSAVQTPLPKPVGTMGNVAVPTPGGNAVNTGTPDTAKPVDAVRTVETGKPVETAKPADNARPAETAKPADRAKPAEMAKPAETAKPADTARPGETAKQKQEPPPQMGVKPSEMKKQDQRKLDEMEKEGAGGNKAADPKRKKVDKAADDEFENLNF